MASADFYAFSAALQLRLRLSARSAQTSPGTTRFFSSIYLPHLPHAIPCSYWASTWYAALPSHIAFYAVPVRQARGLPVVSLFPHPASFRFRLTTDTLAFGFLLPATGRIRVFHPLETCAAGRTQKPLDGFCFVEGLRLCFGERCTPSLLLWERWLSAAKLDEMGAQRGNPVTWLCTAKRENPLLPHVYPC